MLRQLAFATLCSIASGSALAQEVSTYDLRALHQQSKRQQAGSHYQTTEIQKRTISMQAYANSALVQDEQANEELVTSFVTHIQSVNERGRPTIMTWTFERFGPELPDGSHRGVEGIELQITETDGRYTYAQNAGQTLANPALEEYLEGQMKDLSDRFPPSYVGSELALLPDENVAVGDSWSIDLERMLSDLEMPLIPASHDQKAIGTLASVDSAGEQENLHIRVEVEFPIENMQGAPCISDCLFSFDIHMTVPADGTPNNRRSTGDMVFKGKYGDPNTQSMSMDMHFEFEDLIQPKSTP